MFVVTTETVTRFVVLQMVEVSGSHDWKTVPKSKWSERVKKKSHI